MIACVVSRWGSPGERVLTEVLFYLAKTPTTWWTSGTEASFKTIHFTFQLKLLLFVSSLSLFIPPTILPSLGSACGNKSIPISSFLWKTCSNITKNHHVDKDHCLVETVVVKKNAWFGLPWWRSGWESACQCKGHGFEPWSGRIPHAAEQLDPWATATEPARLEPVLRNKRGRDSERPAHRDEEWPPLAATRESPLMKRRPNTAKKINKFKKKS